MAYKIAGGTKWWQVRAGEGVEAEWIVMRKDYREGLGRDKEAWKEREREAKGKGKSKKEERMDERNREEGEPMVGEDGGADENGDCKSLIFRRPE